MRIADYENLPPGGALRASFELGRQLLQRGHTLDLFRLSTYAEKGPFDLAPLVGRPPDRLLLPGAASRRDRTGDPGPAPPAAGELALSGRPGAAGRGPPGEPTIDPGGPGQRRARDRDRGQLGLQPGAGLGRLP